MLWFIIIAIIVLFDQSAKYAVAKNIELGSSVTVINNFFYLTHSKNTGAAFGILKNGRYFFVILTAILLIALIYMLIKADNKLLKTSLSFIIGGAIGNLIDRVLTGKVTDFLDFPIVSFIFPNFNIADSFVVVGTTLLAIYLLFIYKDNEKEKVEE